MRLSKHRMERIYNVVNYQNKIAIIYFKDGCGCKSLGDFTFDCIDNEVTAIELQQNNSTSIIDMDKIEAISIRTKS